MSKYHIPRPVKTCWCIPLRRGIIAFSYANLAISVVAYSALLGIDLLTDVFCRPLAHTDSEFVKLSTTKITPWSNIILFYGGALAELIMLVVNLVGLHTKSLKLVKAYLYYTSVFTLLVFITRCLYLSGCLLRPQIGILAVFMIFKIYYIILLRSLVKKLQNKENTTEAEVELNTVKKEDEKDEENAPEANTEEEDTSALCRKESI